MDCAKELKERFNAKDDEFFYIADSAAFTKDFLQKASRLNIDVITRMTDNLVTVKDAFNYALDHLEELKSVEIPTTTKPTKYLVYEKACEYHGVPLKMVICYSEKLRSQKERTIEKRITKEHKLLREISNELKKRSFACETDAELEIVKLVSGSLKKLKYHTTGLSIREIETKRRGRPSKDPKKNQTTISFSISMSIERDEERIVRHLNKECLFVLASTKLTMPAEEILKE